jgi:hypothetical protein
LPQKLKYPGSALAPCKKYGFIIKKLIKKIIKANALIANSSFNRFLSDQYNPKARPIVYNEASSLVSKKIKMLGIQIIFLFSIQPMAKKSKAGIKKTSIWKLVFNIFPIQELVK